MDLDNQYGTIFSNVQLIQNHIVELSQACGRRPNDVSLVAVTKTQAWPACEAAIKAGAMIIGENRLQEAQEKIPDNFQHSFPDVQLHFIGHLQKNKIRKAVSFFQCIQSVDDPETLMLIDQEATRQGKHLDIYCEVNSSGEASKSGCRSADELFHLVEKASTLPALTLKGLMTIGPLGNDEKLIRKAFAWVRELSETCASRFDLPHWGGLSMGMSGDYPWAIQEGATLIRIGTALFGPRLDRVPGGQK